MTYDELLEAAGYSEVDRRRIRDGDVAAAAASEPLTADGIRAEMDSLLDGLLALQSTDDLGSAANDAVEAQMQKLYARRQSLKKQLAEMSGQPP